MGSPVYTAIDSAHGEIRLLVLEPATSYDDPLVCLLVPTFLSDSPQFEALSYTWGSPGIPSEISLNGHPFSVQENAAAAMRRLRHKDRPRTMWIDAICINQSDIHEKEGQLPLMQRIYEQAEQVCVWLGEPTESTEIAIEDLQNSFSQAPTATTEKSIVNNYMATLLGPSFPLLRNITSGTAWQWSELLGMELNCGDLRELLSRPWWSRVWIIQEAVLGKKVVVMVGGESFPWENIERSLERVRKGKFLQGGQGVVELFGIVLNPEMYSMQDETFRLISRLRAAWHAGSLSTTIYEILYDFRHLQCTNQRDRVFGCLGLLGAGGWFPEILPDYTSSTKDVYIRAALSIITNTRTLDILNCVREWRGVDKPATTSHAFCLQDQARYHDVGAMVSDGPGKKLRRGWARLPPGWERIPVIQNTKLGGLTMLKTMWRGKTARYYNHNTNTTHDDSPLEGKTPPLCLHPALQRELPPGWVKRWDNLGRATVSYDHANQKPSPAVAETSHPADLLDSLPSWVPNWAAPTHLDPRPLLDWSDANPRYNACASTPATAIDEGSTLLVDGILFDTIIALSEPWHPTAPIITRRGAPVLETWETLALDTSIFSPHPCPYSTFLESGRKEALWRTHMADSPAPNHADSTTTRPLIDAWYDRSGWGKHLPSLAERSAQNIWQATGDEVDAKWLHWDLHAELRRAEGDDFKTSKKTDEMYARLIKRIQDVCAHRRLFVTRRGYIGLGPWNAQVEDAVCVLKGGKTPFLLRGKEGEKDEGVYELVGEAYVHGLMGGEFMVGREGKETWRLFCLV